MGELLTQALDVVAREVGHDDAAARSQHTCGLSEDRGRVVGEVQDLMDGNGIEGRLGPGQMIHVAITHIRPRYAGAREIGPRHGQHFARAVDTHARGAL